MKKVWLVILGLLAGAGMAVPVFASPTFLGSENGTVTVGNPINNDVYIGGGTIVVDKPIQGDLVAGGGTIEVNANVSGDVWVMGGTVTIRGNVGDDLRIGGGQISLYSTVGDDVLVGGGSLTVGQAGVIKGDLITGNGNLSLAGKVLGSVMAGVDSADVSGQISGGMKIHAEKLTFAQGAKINGTLEYWAPTESSDFAKYASGIKYHKAVSEQWKGTMAIGALTAAGIVVLFWKWISLLILGGLLILFLPKLLPKAASYVKSNHWEAVWRGLIVLILVPVLAILGMMTVVGIPIALVLLLAYGILLMFAWIMGSYFLGQIILRKSGTPGHQFGALALGSAIAILLAIVPVIGWLARLWIILMGIGGIIHEKQKLDESYK